MHWGKAKDVQTRRCNWGIRAPEMPNCTVPRIRDPAFFSVVYLDKGMQTVAGAHLRNEHFPAVGVCFGAFGSLDRACHPASNTLTMKHLVTYWGWHPNCQF
jgi:hypothetical protein